jgi:carboxylesterase type B
MMVLWIFRLFLVSMVIPTSRSADDIGSDYHARTRLGPIIGKRYNLFNNQGTLYKFLNIPYAKAPLGQLRFAKPLPFGSWKSPLNATVKGPACYQAISEINQNLNNLSEDCLQLNIYVPNNFDPSSKKSVMVWIHGGGYIIGSGTSYDGGYLALTGDVIVVTINYRLGIFGFLASRNYKARGNMGLWDQILALNWVRYNIHDYGGNPMDVTIFGESAGGWSVSLLALITNNRGLFHRVIAESGVANSPAAFTNSSLSTIRTAEIAGCTHDPLMSSDEALLQCLRGLDPEELVNATNAFIIELGIHILSFKHFGPTIDGELFRREPSVLLEDRTSSEYNFFQSLDFMTGNCGNEGSIVVSLLPLIQAQLHFNTSIGLPKTGMCNTLLSYVLRDEIKSNGKALNAVCDMYTVNGDLGAQGQRFLELISDYTFIAGATSSLNHHANKRQGTSTYQYVFFDENSFLLAKAPSWYRGSAHGTELSYLFLYEQLKPQVKYSEGADILVKRMRSYWTNFAKTG